MLHMCVDSFTRAKVDRVNNTSATIDVTPQPWFAWILGHMAIHWDLTLSTILFSHAVSHALLACCQLTVEKNTSLAAHSNNTHSLGSQALTKMNRPSHTFSLGLKIQFWTDNTFVNLKRRPNKGSFARIWSGIVASHYSTAAFEHLSIRWRYKTFSP